MKLNITICKQKPKPVSSLLISAKGDYFQPKLWLGDRFTRAVDLKKIMLSLDNDKWKNELFLKPILLTHWYHNFIIFILMTTSKWWISKTKEIYFFVKTHFAKLYIFIAFQVKWVLVMIGKHFKDKTCVLHLKFDWNIWSLQEIVDNYIIFKLRTKLVAEVLYSGRL